MTDPDVVTKKLATLAEHLRRAEARRARPLDDFLSQHDLQDALAMSLFVAVQEALDIAFHVCADEGWGVPSSNAESFEILGRQGVLAPSLATEMILVARLRNRIAHGYATVDAERLWRESPAGVEALRRFAAAVATWVGV